MFQIVIGDILESKEDYIRHQVNCQNVMGYGVANGDWKKVESMMVKYLCDCNVKVYMKK